MLPCPRDYLLAQKVRPYAEFDQFVPLAGGLLLLLGGEERQGRRPLFWPARILIPPPVIRFTELGILQIAPPVVAKAVDDPQERLLCIAGIHLPLTAYARFDRWPQPREMQDQVHRSEPLCIAVFRC